MVRYLPDDPAKVTREELNKAMKQRLLGTPYEGPRCKNCEGPKFMYGSVRGWCCPKCHPDNLARPNDRSA